MWQVLGQNRAIDLLQRSLKTGTLAHAYLFVGPPHIGKMTLAVNLAQALNCEGAGLPCGECLSCQKVAQGKHVDVQVISLAQDTDEVGAKSRAEISIEQIRQLQHSASLPPFEGKYKVFIIDGAESLSIEAANCLLKTLEEPVGKVVFILLTINERLLPATVVSRCQRVELLRSAPSEIEVALMNNWSVEPQKAKLLARLSHGCLGWAVRAIDNDSLEERAGRLDELVDILDAGNEERFAYSAQLVNEFNQHREVVQERLDLWLDWWHDLLLVKTGSGNIVTNIDRLDALTDIEKGYNLSQIRDFIENIRVAGNQLRLNANPQLVFEVLMLSIPEAEKRGAGRAAQIEVNHG